MRVTSVPEEALDGTVMVTVPLALPPLMVTEEGDVEL